LALAAISCTSKQPAQVCPVPVELNETAALVGCYEGLELLVVVDDSPSMKNEQEVLPSAFLNLVNALTNPVSDWYYSSVDEMRLAVVTSDMGLQWGGHPYQDGDGWPDDAIPCSPAGRDGRFRTYGPGSTVHLRDGEIPCYEDGSQCPSGWSCEEVDEGGVGSCEAPQDQGQDLSCPEPGADRIEWHPEDEFDPDAALKSSCLACAGADGCELEQPLSAAVRALSRQDQQGFLSPRLLLAVMVISDEDDCSIAASDFFLSPELQEPGARAVDRACVQGGQHLYTAEEIRNAIFNAKSGTYEQHPGNSDVLFVAIAGVPTNDTCQGNGNDLESAHCLDHELMQVEHVVPPQGQEDEDGAGLHPACTLVDGAEELVRASPGRRYVELAQEFGNMGYVHSICNSDWSPAVEDIAEFLAPVHQPCFPKRLDYDQGGKRAKCDLLVEYIDREPDPESCPAFFGPEAGAGAATWIDGGGEEHTRVFCRLPQLEGALHCSDIDQQMLEEINEELGWYYCENTAIESFDEACWDGLDNDGDGSTDCDDEGCQGCPVCGGSGAGCEELCKHEVELSDEAWKMVARQSLTIQCIQRFSSPDPNCQENTARACNDGLDNDGNGGWDCKSDFSNDPGHEADFNCCPMHVGDNNQCVIEDEALRICEMTRQSPSDACLAHAQKLECEL